MVELAIVLGVISVVLFIVTIRLLTPRRRRGESL